MSESPDLVSLEHSRITALTFAASTNPATVEELLQSANKVQTYILNGAIDDEPEADNLSQ